MPTKKEEKRLVASSIYDRIHVIPSPGGWPIPQFRIPTRMLRKITAECERITFKSKRKAAIGFHPLLGINGGMKIPHLHFKNEIILLDKPALQKYLQVAAKEVAKIDDITDIGEFVRPRGM